MKGLSEGARRLTGQPAFKVLARAKKLERLGRDILHFEIGEPDFDTPRHIKEAAYQAMLDGKTNYVNSWGIPELKEAICDEVEMTRGFRPDLEQIMVAPGANPFIYYIMACTVGPKKNIVVGSPGFMSYFANLDYTGFEGRFVVLMEENEFRMNPEDMVKQMDENTSLIIMNSPSNPCGSVMTKTEIERMAEIAEEKDVYLMSDEIYSKMTYDQEFFSPATLDDCRARTILIDGFSKAYAMTGWRLGYAVGPAKLIDKMGLLLQTILSCTPPFIQYGGIAALKGDQKCVSDMMAEFRTRRDAIVAGLNSLPNISCVNPEGAFYAFPNITGTGMTSQEFADHLLDEMGIAVLPGTAFGPSGEGYVRFSYASSVEDINKAIERMREKL
jgi:aspartate/methionine/tyrosine aminotransferase